MNLKILESKGNNLKLLSNQLRIKSTFLELKCKQQALLTVKKVYYSIDSKVSQNLDAHNPSEIQNKWYVLWQKKLKNFNQQKDRKVFSMLFPPPNVTGNLHLGHAITTTIQDAIVRWKLMNNFRAFWIPGYDHAGIATQVVVEKKIWNEKKMTRHNLGKDKFLEEVFKWKEEKSNNIKEQMIKLNALSEWDYQYFTMDKEISKCVNEAFIRLFEKDLIHRAYRPINWCCSLKSAISDVEVENLTIEKRTFIKIPNYKKPIEFGLIYWIAYPIEGTNKEIVVATTRPETIFGDTAIAVNPDDSRYSNLNCKLVRNPLTNEKIPIIFDTKVDKNFHTGALKITPFHDTNDYEVGLRHNLKVKQIFNDEGCLVNVPEEFLNVPRFEARLKVVEKIKSLNLLRDIKEHSMVLPLCSRTGDVIEPFLKDQWFVKSSEIFKICEESVQNGSLKLIPDFRLNLWNHYVKSYTKDWCISRQLWWGQQIPSYKCWPKNDLNNFKWFAGHTKSEALQKAIDYFKTKDLEIQQDEDVFDTWFTSTILPLAALGWPDKSNKKDEINRLLFDKLYPTDILETGYDIMYFWAYRMVGMCHALSGQIPYSKILFHGLIRDSQGRKMSKSIGNVIDPIDLIDGASLEELKSRILVSNLDNKEKMLSIKKQETQFPKGIEAVGSDATRLALLVQDFKSDNINIDINLFQDSKRYCNKIWQAIRYSQMCTESSKQKSFKLLTLNQIIESKKYRLIDAWIIYQLKNTIKYIETKFDNEYNFHLIVKRLREFFYADFCDFYLESTKPVFKTNDNALEEMVWSILRQVNNNILLMYHPFIPSITEELWHKNYVGDKNFDSILDFKYPSSSDLIDFSDQNFEEINEIIKTCKAIINKVLGLRKSLQTNERPSVIVECSDTQELQNLSKEIIHLGKLKTIDFNVKEKYNFKYLVNTTINEKCSITIGFENEVNIGLAISRYEKNLEKNLIQVKIMNKKLNDMKEKKDSDYLTEKLETNLKEIYADIESIKEQIKILNNMRK